MSEEQAFLEAIAVRPDDPAARLIYADWLDEQGDPRAAVLRTLLEWETLPSEDDRRASLALAMAELKPPAEWLARVANPPIELCAEEECPEQWQSLTRGHDAQIRDCHACRRQVHWCRSALDARAHTWLGEPAVISPSAARSPGDVLPPEYDPELMQARRRHRERNRARRKRGWFG